MTVNELTLKKELSLDHPKSVYLLYGDEPLLVSAYRRRIATRLAQGGESPERISGQKLDVSALAESADLLPMLGSLRVLLIEELESETLSDADCKALCALIGALPESAALLFSAKVGTFDPKKGPRAKKIAAAVDQAGILACLHRRTGAELKNFARARCEKRGCGLSADDASLLVERCGGDLGTLGNECDKLCAYLGKNQSITKETILRVCSPPLEGDVYAIARLLLKGNAAPVLREIDALLRLRQPAALLLSSLGMAFCDLYRAATARTAGRQASDLAREFHYRFEWKAQNAFRDSARLDARRLLCACRILCDAETTLKSSSADERILLETTAIRVLAALREDPVC